MDSVPAPAERRHVGVLTVLSALVLLAFIALLGWLHYKGSRVEDMGDHEGVLALGLVVGRTLDLDEGVDGAPAWERRSYRLLLSDRKDDLAEGIRWFEELADQTLEPAVDLHLAILEAEAGRREGVRRRVREWEQRDEPFPTLASLMAAAYLGRELAGEPDADIQAETRALLPPGWFRDRLGVRLAMRTGDDELVATARAASAARANRLLWRLRAIAGAEALVLGVGLVVLVIIVAGSARPGRGVGGLRQVRIGPVVMPPPWRGRAGVVVLLHGGALGALLITAVYLVPLAGPQLPFVRVIVATASNLAFVPLLLLARRRLLKPAALGLGAGLGLVPAPHALVPLAGALLALLALGQAGESALGWAARALDLSSHWTEWFDRDLAWGAPGVVAVELFDTVVLTPIFEEIIFRGLLFATLRRKLGVGPAAALSAAIFAGAHGYGAPGFAAVFWSGLLWALAYEKTGSLLPSIAAHAVDNLGTSLSVLLVLRA